MKCDAGKHHRHSIRLTGYNYSSRGAYFITICTRDRKCLFGDVLNGGMVSDDAGKIAEAWWLQIEKNSWGVDIDKFIIMPNHIHGIIIVNYVGAIHELPLQNKIARRQMLIPKIVGYYKMNAAKHINQFYNTTGIPLWQRNYYEHIIRSEDELNRIREYIINNPLQWQFDRENPNVGAYCNMPLHNQWCDLEEKIYGKPKKFSQTHLTPIPQCLYQGYL